MYSFTEKNIAIHVFFKSLLECNNINGLILIQNISFSPNRDKITRTHKVSQMTQFGKGYS